MDPAHSFTPVLTDSAPFPPLPISPFPPATFLSPSPDSVMGVSAFGSLAPEAFGAFDRAFVTMFRVLAGDTWVRMALSGIFFFFRGDAVGHEA
jgi:hypothetical protein